ncbi:hypothetical protein [Bacillus sp. JCM 19041]|uniref:hypothetical protein n=1 Tax=Bacillus sp. JCM 19041 TaxID=1460637 RepID=UPI000AB30D76
MIHPRLYGFLYFITKNSQKIPNAVNVTSPATAGNPSYIVLCKSLAGAALGGFIFFGLI